ncbi:MAG: hypothetical protein P1P90_04475 [Patescibacteria group bacterium]|nr:hypothetical protein [Patescibacteria group bacterium]
MRFEEPQTSKEIPLPHIQIPDMSPIDEKIDGYGRSKKIKFDINLNSKQLKGIVTINRLIQEEYPADISIESYDPELDEFEGRMSSFKAVLNNDKNSRFQHLTSDKKFHPHWQIHTRRIDKSLRHKGFGGLNMKLLEQIIRQITEQYPDLGADWIELDTRLGSISNLIVDPNWLEKIADQEDAALIKRSQNKNLNLGYIPHPQDTENAKKILAQTTEELDESEAALSVTFIKIINPIFNIDQFQVNENPFDY